MFLFALRRDDPDNDIGIEEDKNPHGMLHKSC